MAKSHAEYVGVAINIVNAGWAKELHLGALAGALLVGVFGLTAPSAVAASTSMVDLGTASTYAVLSGASIGNTVSAAGAPHTTLRGDLGVKANTQPTGFPPGVVTGAIDVGNAAAAQAHADLVAAYNEVAGRTGGAALAGALAGTTITPGLHTIAGAVSNTGTVTLDGGGQPERRLRLPGQRRHGHGRRKPCRADQRRPGVPGVLAGQRRRRHRRERRLRRNAHGARRGRGG